MKYTIEAIENAKPGMRWEEIDLEYVKERLDSDKVLLKLDKGILKRDKEYLERNKRDLKPREDGLDRQETPS